VETLHVFLVLLTLQEELFSEPFVFANIPFSSLSKAFIHPVSFTSGFEAKRLVVFERLEVSRVKRLVIFETK
jgi:hypothetical protein